jgi:poly(3-hydroxybutyrate) depolymerase
LEAGGNQDFQSGDDQRTFQLVLPAEPQGAPVVFVWHWLGGNGRQILNYGGFDAFAEEHGAIVIAPETRGIPYEWDTFDGADTPDLLFFDDMLSCVSEQLGADLSRVYSTGMSAGGLWTVTLSHYRSSWLAASAPLSGGATVKDWSPEESIPMMLTWGGPTDIYGSGASAFSFDDANILLADQLAESGHFQVHCVHSNGHTLPPGGSDYVWSFFEAHPKGVASSPWSDALPGSLPDWCTLPE